MPRYALRIEYDGQPFAGWQRQADQPSVQAAIEEALSRLENGVPSIAAAGRTDAGVHALGQVAHCDLAQDWDPFRLSEALNYHLKPDPVAVTGCKRVSEDWHARFSAVERRYLYRIVLRRASLVHPLNQVPGENSGKNNGRDHAEHSGAYSGHRNPRRASGPQLSAQPGAVDRRDAGKGRRGCLGTA